MTDDRWMYGAGLGPTLRAGRTTLDIEAMAWHVMYGEQRPWGERAPDSLNLLTQLRVVAGLPLGRAHLVVGASADVFITTDPSRPISGARYAGGTMSTSGTADDVHVELWPSVFVGARL